MSTKTIKIQARGTVTIPRDMRSSVNIDTGDLVDVSLERGGVFIKPVSRTDEAFQKSLHKALNDLKSGTVHGPFSSSQQLRAYAKR